MFGGVWSSVPPTAATPKVDLVVHDIRGATEFAGHATTIVPFSGETAVELSQRGALRYEAVLRVARGEIPKGAA